MTASKSPLVRFVQFLGKVKFTTVLLLGGAVIMTVGTIVESRESREVAWSAIYGTLWFDVFLLLIGVNLVVAVVNRIPIQRHQWPFVVTHFSIVTLLVGAWISTTFGYEGRLVVTEGSEESRLLLDTSEIRTRWLPGAHGSDPGHTHDGGVEAVFPVTTNRSGSPSTSRTAWPRSSSPRRGQGGPPASSSLSPVASNGPSGG
jgi:hypothetical protein